MGSKRPAISAEAKYGERNDEKNAEEPKLGDPEIMVQNTSMRGTDEKGSMM